MKKINSRNVMKLIPILIGVTLVFLSIKNPSVIKERENQLSLDTILLNKDFHFLTEIDLIIDNCEVTISDEKSVSKKEIQSFLNLLEKELGFNFNNAIDIIVNKSLKEDSRNSWISLQEWHFDSEGKREKVSEQLDKLKKGELKKSIVPTAIRWIKADSKIIVIKYKPLIRDNNFIGNLHQCIYENYSP